jgi:hypothetical protein
MQPSWSVALTVNVFVTVNVGVPVIVPPEDKVSPDGNVPTIFVNTYGPNPPLAVIVCVLYTTPTLPVARTLDCTVIVGQFTTSV